MAIYHLSVKIVSRSKGQSVIAKAAYRAGEKMRDDETGKTYDYTRKKEVAFSEITLCKNAPSEYADRKTLWSAVQKIETDCNARLAREVEVALPKEFDIETQKKVLREYIAKNFVSKGMIADWSIHAKEGNPHAHILLTTRGIKESGEWDAKRTLKYAMKDAQGNLMPIDDLQKNDPRRIPILNEDGTQKLGTRNRKMWVRIEADVNDWNDRENVEKWRKSWAETCNARLPRENKIDHRSYARQGVDKIPQMKVGVAQYAMKKRGVGLIFDKIEINERTKDLWQLAKTKIQEVADEQRRRFEELKQRIAGGNREIRRGERAARLREWRVDRSHLQGNQRFDFESVRAGIGDAIAGISGKIADFVENYRFRQENRRVESLKTQTATDELCRKKNSRVDAWLEKIRAMSPQDWEKFMKYADVGNVQYQYCGEYKRLEIDAQKRAQIAWIERSRTAKIAHFSEICIESKKRFDALKNRRPADIADKPALSLFHTFTASDGANFKKYDDYREHAQKLLDDWQREMEEVAGKHDFAMAERKRWLNDTAEDIRKHVFDGVKMRISRQDADEIRQIYRETEFDAIAMKAAVKKMRPQKDGELAEFKAERRRLRPQSIGLGQTR